MEQTKKRSGFGLEMKTIEGKNGPHLFFRTRGGSYHVFTEVEAKAAARDCGATEMRSSDEKENTHEMCRQVWDKS